MNSIATATWCVCLGVVTCGCLMSADMAMAADEVNYDESKVPEYTLPDPLVMENGQPVETAAEWWNHRRPETFALFETQMYGKAPKPLPGLHFELVDHDTEAFGGTAIRKQVRIYFSEDESGPKMDLLLYLPKRVSGQRPVFLGLNFAGNHTTTDDPNVLITSSWQRPREGVVDHHATEAGRGTSKSRWPIQKVLARGYGVGTIYYGDIDPDYDDGFENGVHGLYHPEQPPAEDEWGSIAAWAWGLSRALDYLETDADVDAQRVCVVGHSRLGKTSLWAGAADQRFALVISNDSGCGGAALSRRRFGEKVKRINSSFPHWFADNFTKYNDRESELPFDQHQLIALMAPRPVLVCSAEDDRWADPKGEFLSAHHATSVYELLGRKGLPQSTMPELNQLVGDTIGYHIRAGKHDMTWVDWQVYLDFADRHFAGD